MNSQSILALAIATIIIIVVQTALILALAPHVMSRTSDALDTVMRYDAELQKSGPPPSVPYNATRTPPATPKEPVEDTQSQAAKEPFDDTDSLYRMPTPPPKDARRNAVVKGMVDGSSSVYSQPAGTDPEAGKDGNTKIKGTEYSDTHGNPERNGAASPVSDYGPVTYRY